MTISEANSGSGSSSRPPPPLRTTKETHPNLPPGLILGPDGKVCKVCNSWQDWGKIKMKKKDAGDASGSGSGSGGRVSGGVGVAGMGGFAAMMSGSIGAGVGTGVGNSTGTGNAVPRRRDRSDCPPDTAALGRSTWTFLHTTAAYYPTRAPPETQTNMRRLLESLSLLYPCVPCANDFQEDMRANPPDLSGRAGLSRWLCERHNEVNDKLGKERFDCSWDSLNRRWKDGPEDGSCD
ncbi:hypothetical protein JCM24511_02867 [Saitozyma sp. JCM 24511]|nr:hypothetical protein JCM24511_02867 [Saitozyma sp. JCM 24511]